MVFVAQVTLPVVLAPLVSGESWGSTPLGGLAIPAFLAAVATGAGLLGRSPAVSGLVGRAAH